MEDKEIDFIISLILAARSETERAIGHCVQRDYEEVEGQILRLDDINSAYASLIQLKIKQKL
jgi:hypothetical protein